VSRRSTPYTCGMHLPRLRRTVVRFATVGVANTVIDVVLFWVLQAPLGILATNGFTMWLLQPAVIGLAHGLAGTPLLATKALALGASVVVNFLLYRYVVWRRPAPRISPTPAPAGLDAAPEAARR
jgi:putative flippase GtrA